MTVDFLFTLLIWDAHGIFCRFCCFDFHGKEHSWVCSSGREEISLFRPLESLLCGSRLRLNEDGKRRTSGDRSSAQALYSIRRLLRSIPSRFFMVTCSTLAIVFWWNCEGTQAARSLCPCPTADCTHGPFIVRRKKRGLPCT